MEEGVVSGEEEEAADSSGDERGSEDEEAADVTPDVTRGDVTQPPVDAADVVGADGRAVLQSAFGQLRAVESGGRDDRSDFTQLEPLMDSHLDPIAEEEPRALYHLPPRLPNMRRGVSARILGLE